MFETDSLHELNSVVSDFYDAALGRCGWNQTLDRAARVLRAPSFALCILNRKSGESRVFTCCLSSSSNFARAMAEEIASARVASTSDAPGEDDDHFTIINDAKMRASENFRAWCLPTSVYADSIGALLDCRSGDVYALAFMRKEGQAAFSDEDERKLQYIVAHALRAVRISGEMDRLRAERDSLAKAVHEAPTPIILVNEDRSIRQINRAAAQLSDRGGFIRNEQGELCFEDQDCARVFNSAVGSGEVQATTIVCKSGSGLVSEVMPGMRGGGPAAIVLVHKAPARAERAASMLRQAYGLTGSELRVLNRLMSGATREAISGDLGISLATVKTHLQSIFRKTGTNRQADLVRKVGGSVAA
jgi:DNA-binding CsgD family transcriptional regulator